jgi:hypothetical protein
MLKGLAKWVSVITHPIFITGYVLLFLIYNNPYVFGFSGEKARGLIIISVLSVSILFPVIAILLMRATGLISSLEMKDKRERIGPLIATGIFYMWLYVNIRNNSQVPAAFSFFMLGSTIAVFMALLFNIFSKISLHTIGMGGLLAGMLIIITNWSYGWIDVEIPLLGTGIVLSDRFVILICILLAGITGSCRLYLGAHRQDEIYGGYLLGIFAQMAGFIIYF